MIDSVNIKAHDIKKLKDIKDVQVLCQDVDDLTDEQDDYL